MINQQVFDRFKHALEEESLVAHPVRDHQTACRLWMEARGDIDGWPAVDIEVPRYQETYAVNWANLDPELVRDIETYLNTLARPQPDDPKAWRRPFRPASLCAVEGNIKRFLGALVAAGVDVHQLRSLKQLVSFDVFKIGMRWLWDRNGGKTGKHIGEVAWTIRCIAVKYIGVDEAEAIKFAGAVRSLRVIQPGLSEKNHRLLSSFDSPEIALKLLRLPLELWRKAEREKEKIGDRKAALLIETAIAIELLIFAPMRAYNLVNLDLQRHFNWQRDRDGERLHIHIEASEVKNSQRLEFALLVATSKRIRTYIADWRPLLSGGKGTALFPGCTGKAKDQSCLSRQITRAVRNALGLTVTPHQFRHIAAKLYLDRHPGAYEVMRRLLGHKILTTTYQHYAGAEIKAAVEHYDNTILELSRADAAPPRRSLKRLLTLRLGTPKGSQWHPRKR
jgi:integrase